MHFSAENIVFLVCANGELARKAETRAPMRWHGAAQTLYAIALILMSGKMRGIGARPECGDSRLIA